VVALRLSRGHFHSFFHFFAHNSYKNNVPYLKNHIKMN
jgi:hypothetical protein